MPEPVTVPLSAGQVAQFRDLARREESARFVPVERSAAALAVVLGHYPAEQVNGQRMAIDVDAGTITFTPNGEP